jgi:hypothetical protein
MSTLLRLAALACAAAITVPVACTGAEGAEEAARPVQLAAATQRGTGAQSGLAARVAAAPAGEVWMHFASRPGVCGGENNISTSGHGRDGNMIIDGDYRDGHHDWSCEEGPVYVALEKQSGRIEGVRVRVAHAWNAEGRGRVTDLGAVGTHEAADYLLGLAEHSADGDVGEKAILPATLADSVTTWPTLLRMARGESIPSETRRSAVFWLSQQAGERITHELAAFVNDNAEDRELRKHAVFALSQRPHEEAIPELLRIARTHHDPEIRKTAMFWLGQSQDPRALALFEEILAH